MSDNISFNLIKKRKRGKKISIALKKQIIDDYLSGQNKKDIASKYNVGYATVHVTLKRREEILKHYKASSADAEVVDRVSIMKNMESILLTWCQERFSEGEPVDLNIVAIKGEHIFEKLRLQSTNPLDMNSTFKADKLWLNNFKKLWKHTRVSDESRENAGDQGNLSTTVSEFSNQLIACIEKDGYCKQTVFNVCNTNLFWKNMPQLSHINKKDYNETVSLILGGNAAGDCKLKPFLVYHSENPEVMKNKSKTGLPVIWKTDPSCSVTPSLFQDWFDHHFIPEVKKFCHSQNIAFKVLLLLEVNYSDETPEVFANLLIVDPRIQVKYIKKNAISIQPMDQGILKTFKAIYMKQMLEVTLQNNQNLTKSSKEIKITDAVIAIGDSWSEVTKTTMNNAWRKICSIFVKSSNITMMDQFEETVNDIVDVLKRVNLESSNENIKTFLKSLDEETVCDDDIEINEMSDEDQDMYETSDEDSLIVESSDEDTEMVEISDEKQSKGELRDRESIMGEISDVKPKISEISNGKLEEYAISDEELVIDETGDAKPEMGKTGDKEIENDEISDRESVMSEINKYEISDGELVIDETGYGELEMGKIGYKETENVEISDGESVISEISDEELVIDEIGNGEPKMDKISDEDTENVEISDEELVIDETDYAEPEIGKIGDIKIEKDVFSVENPEMNVICYGEPVKDECEELDECNITYEGKDQLMTEKLKEGLVLIESGLKTFESADSNKARVGVVRQAVQKAIQYYTELLKKRKDEPDPY